jgi:hypothetical protein
MEPVLFYLHDNKFVYFGFFAPINGWSSNISSPTIQNISPSSVKCLVKQFFIYLSSAHQIVSFAIPRIFKVKYSQGNTVKRLFTRKTKWLRWDVLSCVSRRRALFAGERARKVPQQPKSTVVATALHSGRDTKQERETAPIFHSRCHWNWK